MKNKLFGGSYKDIDNDMTLNSQLLIQNGTDSYRTWRAKRAVCIPNLNRVKIEAEGRCYLPTRLRYHGRVLARCHILAVAN